MTKRLLALVLTLAMILTMVPVIASAASENYLTFTAEADGSRVDFSYASATSVYCRWSNSGKDSDYNNWQDCSGSGISVFLNTKGAKVQFKGENVTTSNEKHFSMTGKVAASGDVTSLTNGTGGDVNLNTTYGSLDYGCYSYMFTDCTSLTKAPNLPSTTLAKNCYQNMFAGCTSLTTAPALPATTLTDSCYSNMFYLCASLATAPTLSATILTANCYEYMFGGCTSLTTAPALSAEKLATNCYMSMFSDCTSLTTVPTLSAKTLADNCCDGMFWGCTSLMISETDYFGGTKWTCPSTGSLTDPVHYMFSDTKGPITSDPEAGKTYYIGGTPKYLTFTAQENSTISFSWAGGSNVQVKASSTSVTIGDASATCEWQDYAANTTITLPANTFVQFKGTNVTTDIDHHFSMTGKVAASGDVTSLTNGTGGDVNLNTTYGSLDYGCYSYMFKGCTQLTTAPALPSTTLYDYCYSNMFYCCEALTTAPVLPATTLAASCYYGMFNGCTQLTTAPNLQAGTLAMSCYKGMFTGCTSLTTAPNLPAETLADDCYDCMFNGCTSLTTVPEELPAKTLADNCYFCMFQNCTSLTTVPKLPATTLAEGCYMGMFYGCTGIHIYTDSGKTEWKIPDEAKSSAANFDMWNVIMFDGTGGTFTGAPEVGTTYYIGENYLTFTAEENSSLLFRWASADSLSIRVSTDGKTYSDWNNLDCSNAAGIHLSSLPAGYKVQFKGTNVTTDVDNHFYMTGKISASGDVTSLTNGVGGNATLTDDGCYANMFNGCESLTTAPALPSTTLADGCYDCMFYYCTSLTTAPALPATTLAENCYNYMFWYCTSLETAPALPATTLAESCYNGMFQNCTSLTTAPKLEATTLVNYCYQSMFNGCTLLETAPALPATTLAESCYNGMFKGCTSLTTAPALNATTLAESCYDGMFEDCTSLTTVPALNATTLADCCYYSMFSGCTGIKVYEDDGKTEWKIPNGASSTAATAASWNYNMFAGTGGDFTGNPVVGTTYYIGEVEKINISTATIEAIDNQTYTGNEIKPTLTVKDGDKTLTLDTDYTVSYKDNTNKGTATATITGIGKYTGTKDATFKIVEKSISGCTIDTIADQTYTGSAIEPALTVKDGETTLALGTDYTVKYENNMDVGTATATITGAGNYSGTKEVTFKIVAKSISGSTIDAIADQTYTGSAIEPALTVKDGEKTLALGTDYTVEYSSNTNVGTATATITGTGNYKETSSKTFSIVAKSVDGCTIETIVAQAYTGNEIKPTLTVKDGDKELKLGTDYTVSYTNNTVAGINTAVATIKGIGNYTGEKTANFSIIQQLEFDSSAKTTVSNKAYDGTKDATAAVTVGTIKDCPAGITVKVKSATIDDKNVGKNKTVTVTYELEGTGAEKYLAPKSETFTIEISPKQLTISAPSAANKEYDGNNAATVTAGTLSGIVPGDTVTVSATGAFANKDVGLSKTVAITYTLGGADAGNYAAPTNENTIANITVKPITVKANAITAVAGGALKTLTYTAEGLVSGESLSGSLATDANKDKVGVYNITQGTLTDANNTNYSISFTGNTYTVKAVEFVNADISSITDKTYTGSEICPVITVTLGDKTLALGTDYTVAYANNINVGTATVTVTGKGIYDGSKTVTFKIVPKTINVVALNKTSTVGNDLVALTYTADDLCGSDVFTGALATTANKDVIGTYDITQGTLALSSNYKINFTKGTYSVGVIDASDMTIDAIPDVTYNGSAFTPEVTVKLGEKTLTLGTDYTVAYANNLNAGTATVTVTCTGNYAGTKTATFTILQKEIKVVADSKESVVGQDLVTLTYKADELIGSDVFTGDLVTTVNNGVVGKYLILQGNLTAGSNYKIKFTNGTYTVKEKEKKIIIPSSEEAKVKEDALNKSIDSLIENRSVPFASDLQKAEKVTLEVKVDVDESNVPETDKALILSKTNAKNINFIDVSLLLTIDGGTPINVGSYNTELISVTYSFDFTDKTNVSVLRVHDGVVDELTETPNKDGEYTICDKKNGTITSVAMRYSTYAIVYDVVEKQPETKKEEIANTGDEAFGAVVATAAMSTVAFLATRKKKEEDQ